MNSEKEIGLYKYFKFFSLAVKLFYPNIIAFFPVRNMRRVSAASVPSVFKTPAKKQEEQLVHCLGQTATLYARSGFFDDEKLVRDSFKCLTNLACT